jgi:L-lactate permease
MSNIIVGNAIQISGTNFPLFLALVHSGSAVGNAVSLQNILMVKSVTLQPEIGYSQIFKFNLLVVGFYALVIILVSLLIFCRC